MNTKTRLVLIVLLTFAAAAWGETVKLDPYIGCVYPAGGQRGTVFQVTLRGQRLGGVKAAYITGGGVSAEIVGYEGPGGPLNRLQQEELKRQLHVIRIERGGKQPEKPASEDINTPIKDENGMSVVLPDLPELRNLEQKTPEQLRKLADKLLNVAKRPKPPIAEMITLEIAVDANAAPGDREIRLQSRAGISNPQLFQISAMPELRETEDAEEEGPTPTGQPPVVLNGRIMPGEVDRFPLTLTGGQKLLIAAEARRLIPYLADAVPGWFQAVVAIYDSDGREVAFCDDCGFDPDPAFIFTVPGSGQYTLEIRDSIYRGREDFVYRVAVCAPALAASAIPTGERGGVRLVSGGKSSADAARGVFGYGFTAVPETEPNDTGKTAMSVKQPAVIRGVIQKPGDKDVFLIEGRAGDAIVAEVCARRVGSPMDSLIRIIDTSGRVLAMNDDQKDSGQGLLTHHADSYVTAKLPADGRCRVQVSDAGRHGGPEYEYYLRVGPPRPDFALRVTPSSFSIPAGRAAEVTVYAIRRDGWDGEIRMALTDAPYGFALSGATIPKGVDKIRMTVSAPGGQNAKPVFLEMEGSAAIEGKTVTHQAIPADDKMQAFAYYHLVPSDVLVAQVSGRGMVSVGLDMPEGKRLRIPSGGSAQVSFYSERPLADAPVEFHLSEPPPGITLEDVTFDKPYITITLKADSEHAGYTDNLIIEGTTEVEARADSGRKRTISLGMLPAVPFVITER